MEKNEERFELAEKAENPTSTRENCEHWLGNVTSWQNIYKIADKIDEVLVSAEGYNYSVQERQTPVEQTKSHHSKLNTSSTLSSTSSQCKHKLVLATMKKPWVKQNEAEFRIAKLRQALELEKIEYRPKKLRKLIVNQWMIPF